MRKDVILNSNDLIKIEKSNESNAAFVRQSIYTYL